jgi:hypothetical protein
VDMSPGGRTTSGLSLVIGAASPSPLDVVSPSTTWDSWLVMATPFRWCSQLDVHPQSLLERGERAQQLVSFRLKAQINIDRCLTPTFEHRGRTPGQIDANGLTRGAPELDGKRPDARLVNRRTHARPRARS